MLNKGFIKLHKKLTDWEWYSDANTFRLFMHLLLTAEYKPKKYKGVIVPIGSSVTGRDALSKVLCLTPQQIRTALNKLKSTNEITIKTTNKFSIITLSKWLDYQDKITIEEKKTEERNQQVTNNQPTSNQQVTTSKEVKNKRTKELFKAKPKDSQMVEEYSATIGFFIDGQKFIDYYQAIGWMRGKSSIKDWKACARTWKTNNYGDSQGNKENQSSYKDL